MSPLLHNESPHHELKTSGGGTNPADVETLVLRKGQSQYYSCGWNFTDCLTQGFECQTRPLVTDHSPTVAKSPLKNCVPGSCGGIARPGSYLKPPCHLGPGKVLISVVMEVGKRKNSTRSPDKCLVTLIIWQLPMIKKVADHQPPSGVEVVHGREGGAQ